MRNSAPQLTAPTVLGVRQRDGQAHSGAVEHVEGGNTEAETVCGQCMKCKLLLAAACFDCTLLQKVTEQKTELGAELETLVLSFTVSFLSPLVPDPEQEPTQN